MKLAIIIPVYNAANTIGETLQSLQAIEHGWEHVDKIVLCNDASMDNSQKIIDDFAFGKCKLELITHMTNLGEAECYKTMIKSLPQEVEWFVILHADDLALPCLITRNIKILQECKTGVATVSSNYYVFDQNGEKLAHSPQEDVIIFRGDGSADVRYTAETGCWWHISGALVKRDAWVKMGGRDPSMPQIGDLDLLLRFQLEGYIVGHSLIATTKYRSHHNYSLSSKSYASLSDISERTTWMLKHPAIFTKDLRRKSAQTYGLSALRRAVKFTTRGCPWDGIRAIKVGFNCVWRLINH